jgi:5-(aminomethyl)-3-furanmethanol phosphate kinase
MSGTKAPRRVVKIGGSLFDHPAWMDDLGQLAENRTWVDDVERWIRSQPAATTLVVMGGGDAVDEVAAEQRTAGFSDAEAHWRCIRVMALHARRMAERMPAWPLILDPRELDGAVVGSTFVLRADAFMEAVDAVLGLGALPESWDVSSDSIAARAAELFAADELVLLKSALPGDMRKLGNYVDPYFAEAAKHLRAIRFVNLRDSAFPEVRLR